MPESTRPPARPARTADGDLTYRQECRRCGKVSCSRCAPGQPGHGPYWYVYWWESGRRRSRYVGRNLPPGIDPTPPAPADEDLRVQTLGAFAVHRGDVALAWSSRRAANLFKCLLSAPAHRLRREQVMELLWPEADPARAATTLRTTTYLLRRTLDIPGGGTHLQTDGDALQLVPVLSPAASPNWLDAATFERLATEALAGRDPAACRVALAQYHGEYLPDDLYDVWTEPTRGHLQQLHVDLLLHLAEMSAGHGELTEAENALQQVLAACPGHEEAATVLMNLLATSGRSDEALRVYHSLAAALEEDLDVAPGVAVEALRARIMAQRAPERAPGPASLVAAREKSNLPAVLTSFVGREWELDEVGELMARNRLVTLTGPGGCGKTRLALEVAGTLVERYPGGVWLVEFAGLESGSLVPSVVANALGVEEQPATPLLETLCATWRQSAMVLVLDNCEHLIPACAALVGALLGECPHLHVLATSREALRVAGEVTHRVPSLITPDPERLASPEEVAEYEAVALFTARARAHRPDFVLTDRNAQVVARICARLDGLPLAIELAAARLGVLSVEGIAERLDDRFRLLAGGPRTALPRQQALRATMDWSHSLLEPAQQLLLRRLAVFAGGWTLEAAEAVCAGEDLSSGGILDWLEGLVQKSLVTRDDGRYSMLETIRQYAREKLVESGEEPVLLDRHASYLAALVAEAGDALGGAEQRAWTDRLEADLDNIRAALQWAQHTGTPELGLRLASPIWRFWMASGQSSEGRRWLDDLMACDAGAGVSDAILAEALNASGSLAYSQSDVTVAERCWARCLELRRSLGDRRGVAEALNGLGVVYTDLGEYAQAEQWLAESCRVWSEAGDPEGALAPLNNLANVARYRGRYARATALYEQVLEARRRSGHVQAVLTTLNNLAQVYADQGEYGRARTLTLEALALAREHGLVGTVVLALGTRGANALEQGRFAEAEDCLVECLRLCRSIGDQVDESYALINLADLALAQRDLQRAADLAEPALAALREFGQQRGQAFALATLSETARLRGEHDRAAALLEECLALRRDMGDAAGTIDALERRARLASSRGQHAEAVCLYGSAEALRTSLGTPLPPIWQPEVAMDIARLRESLGLDDFAARWSEGQALAPTYLPIVTELSGEVGM